MATKRALVISGLIALSFPMALLAQTNNQVPPMNPYPVQAVPAAPPTQAQRPAAPPVAAQEPIPPQAEPVPISATTSDPIAQPQPVGADKEDGSPSAGLLLPLIALIIFLVALGAWIRKLLEGLKSGATVPVTEEKKPCERCGGKGTITEKFTKTVNCVHCKGSGQDPCHDCGGTGKMTMPNPANSEEELENWPPCDFCGGSGRKRVGAGRDWGEANEAVAGGIGCCMCHGKKTESYTETREAPCPDCSKK